MAARLSSARKCLDQAAQARAPYLPQASAGLF